MVIPTQKYAVIGVGWPVIGIFGDVVDLRPSSLHTTARNHTPAIAKRDCSALVSVEDSLFGAQAQNMSVVGHQDALGDSDTAGVLGRVERDRLPVRPDVRPPGASGEIFLPH